jgi:hypothetical protein
VPVVPKYQEPRVQEQGLAGVRISPDVSPEAFGTGRSFDKMEQATQQLGGVAQGIAQEEKKKADQIAHIAADGAASKAQTDLQVSISKMEGRDAAAAPDYAQEQWKKTIQPIRDGLSNDDQKLAFDKSTAARWDEIYKHTQLHVAGQLKAYDDKETDSYIQTSRNAAVLNAGDDDKVSAELARQTDAVKTWAQRNGVYKEGQPSPVYEAKLAQVLSNTHDDIIKAHLDAGNDQKAKDYFDAHKEQMDAKDVLSATKAIEDGMATTRGKNAWEQVKGIRLADGTPNEAKMREQVMAMPDLSEKEKEKAFDYVKTRASEDIANKNREDSARDRSFMNNVLNARKQGLPIDDAMKLVPRFGVDTYDQATKADVVKKIYAPPSDSDPATFIKTWERVQGNQATKAEIDAAKDNNLINVQDWRHLREEYYKVNTEGKNADQKVMEERIKALADQQYGSNKLARENFLYDLHTSTRGKSAEEKWKTANDKLKGDPETGIWGFFQSSQWKTDIQKTDASNIAFGKLHEDLGRDVTNAIGQEALYSGKEKWGVGDVDAFAARYGGYDKIKSGTPVNNAAQSLLRRNQRASPANIDAVLKRYPDGKF